MRAKLVADPVNFGTTVEYEGGGGSIILEARGKASEGNPRTSKIVPFSVIKSLRNISSTVGIGV